MFHYLFKHYLIQLGCIRMLCNKHQHMVDSTLLPYVVILYLDCIQSEERLLLQTIHNGRIWCCPNHLRQLPLWRATATTQYPSMDWKCTLDHWSHLVKQRQCQGTSLTFRCMNNQTRALSKVNIQRCTQYLTATDKV